MVLDDIDFRTVEKEKRPKKFVTTMCGAPHSEKTCD